MNQREPDLRPHNPRSPLPGAVLVVILVLAAFFGWRWWQQLPVHQSGNAPVASPASSTPDDGAPVPEAPAASASPQNPAEAIAEPMAGLPALDDSDAAARAGLLQWLGAERMAAFLQVDGFVRRVVVTVDNLARVHAAPARWPVRPTEGRIVLEGEGDLPTLSPANSARYAPFVRFAESLDSASGARIYAQFYPLFQQAYDELGYPGRYFNDRLIEVIDHVLAAPQSTEPLAIRVVEVRGDVPSERPWVRYEFADPRLQALSPGHKLMLRVGPDNAQRIKAVLRNWRGQLARAGGARPAQ